jgi:hypothetical protein
MPLKRAGRQVDRLVDKLLEDGALHLSTIIDDGRDLSTGLKALKLKGFRLLLRLNFS